MPEVVVPQPWWRPRSYQMPAWSALEAGARRVALVWHRRAGKDDLALNWTVVAAAERPGVYWHLFPTGQQGRKALWEGIDRDGRPFLSRWPDALVASRNNNEMALTLANGSVWRVIGSDTYDRSLIGANPRGIVLSEYSLQNPAAWDLLRPILAENGGWAIFPFTPRGRNHGHDLFRAAEANPDRWFAQRLTVDDTGAITRDAIEEERRAGMPDELIRQEFWCDFNAGQVGAYYASRIEELRKCGRVCAVPHDPALPVVTAWDLGVDDMTSIWFVQRVGREVRVIDHLRDRGHGVDHYARALLAKPYTYAEHLWPHDGAVKEFGSGRTRKDTAEALGIKPIRILPAGRVEDGINAVRNLVPRCLFDATRTAAGLDALEQYRQEWDAERKTFSGKPLHDWTSHDADAFRYLAVGLDERDAATGPIRRRLGGIV